jgi:hypothetical protein
MTTIKILVAVSEKQEQSIGSNGQKQPKLTLVAGPALPSEPESEFSIIAWIF